MSNFAGISISRDEIVACGLVCTVALKRIFGGVTERQRIFFLENYIHDATQANVPNHRMTMNLCRKIHR